MPKVLIATTTLAGLDGPFRQLLCDAGFEVVYPRLRKPLTEDELLVELQGVAASIAGFEPYTRRVIEASPQLRVIARNGVGYDAVDVVAATEHGIAVTVTPGANQESVAEHTFALLLALARAVVPQHTAIRGGEFRRVAGVPLRGRTLGLVGLGRIGREVALRAAAFRMRILAHEPLPDVGFVQQHGITLAPLAQLLAESDFISLHVPLTAESQHLIDARALSLMKPTALLINTARGGLICEDDLVQALRDGRIAGAGLDVFADEPPPRDHPLTQLDNVICTAHTAGIDLQARDDMAMLAAGAIVALSRGQWPEQQVVNPECRAKFRMP
jgi:D-3-phosphoglycerate dehydrogenase